MSDDIQGAINAGNNNGRQVMGESIIGSFIDASAKYVTKFVVPRKGAKGGMVRGAVGKRNQIMAESLGAAFAPKANMSGGSDPSAGYTQGNGRIIPSRMGRTDSFYGGSAD